MTNTKKKSFSAFPVFLSFFLMTIIMLTYAPITSASTLTNRLAGYDHYKTAVAISQSGWPDGADTAILALGEDFPDALSAGPLAHKFNAPILLTNSYVLNSDTVAELKRLKVKKVYIIGGTAVVSSSIERQLSLMNITTERLAGYDRYETALIVAQKIGVKQGVFVTNGLTFADALSIGPIAAALEMPILLVPPDKLTPALISFLSKNKISTSFIVNGGELSYNVVNQFPNSEVIYGYDPYERNINLINRFSASLDLDNIYLATGQRFPDALTASALVQKGKNALVLLQGDSIPYPATSFMRSKIISKLTILGGTAVISDSTKLKLASLPPEIDSVEDVTDSVQESQKYDPPKTVTVTTTNGLTEEVPVTWSLSSVRTLRSGTYKFEGTINNYHRHVYLNLTVYPKISKINTISAEIILGDSYSFPDRVDATMSDGSTEALPVTWTSKIVPLNKVGTYTFQGTIDGLTQKASLSLKVSEDAKINFIDPGLRSVVEDKVNKDWDEAIYKSDVIDITTLNARSEGITDLTGLEYFTKLRTLDLGNNSITKLAPLTKLTNLSTLKLHNNELEDLKALKGLISLTHLDISDNYITDFTTLKYLTKLTTLYLDDNDPIDYIEDYTPDYSPVRLYYKNLDRKDFSL